MMEVSHWEVPSENGFAITRHAKCDDVEFVQSEVHIGAAIDVAGWRTKVGHIVIWTGAVWRGNEYSAALFKDQAQETSLLERRVFGTQDDAFIWAASRAKEILGGEKK